MAFYWHSVLSFLFLVCITINSICGFPSNQHIDLQGKPIIDHDATSYNKMELRSVLWPKICFKPSKRNAEEYASDPNQQQSSNNRIHLKRNLRKCYPFDTS